MSLTRRRRSGRVNRQGLLTILFTDLEGSTAMTQRLGDARAQEVVRAHNTIVRREVSARGGTEVKHTGDGIMATFPSAARAVAAAVAMQKATRTYNDAHPETAFNIAIGLNAGEPVAEDADVFGSAVQMAARTCAQAHGGQILATNVVRELVFGKGALFADTGAAELKGFGEAIHLFEVGVGAEGIDEGDWSEGGIDFRWFAAGAAALAVVIAAGITTFMLTRSGGGAANLAGVPSTEVRFQTKVTTGLKVLGGDCATTDLTLEGLTSGPVTGGFNGLLDATSHVAQPIAENCQSVIVISVGRIVAGGDAIAFADFLRARPRVGKFDTANPIAAPAALEGTDLWIVTGGEGRYAGATGDGRCEIAGLSLQGINATSDLNCVLNVNVSGSPAAISLRAESGLREIAAGVSQAAPSQTEVFIIYRNNTAAPLTGLSAGLGASAGARLTAAPVGQVLQPVSDRTRWALPDLAAGEVGRLRLNMRVLSTDSTTLTLTPDISADGLAQPARSAAVSIAVVK